MRLRELWLGDACHLRHVPAVAEERKSIREQADECRAQIEAAQAEKAEAPTRAARKELNRRIHMLEDMEKWFRSRAGYV
jgi:hypothetical protein